MNFWDRVREIIEETEGDLLIEVQTGDNPTRLDRIWQDALSDIVDCVSNHWTPWNACGILEIRVSGRCVLVDWTYVSGENVLVGYRRLGPGEAMNILEANERRIYNGAVIESSVIRLMSERF